MISWFVTGGVPPLQRELLRSPLLAHLVGLSGVDMVVKGCPKEANIHRHLLGGPLKPAVPQDDTSRVTCHAVDLHGADFGYK